MIKLLKNNLKIMKNSEKSIPKRNILSYPHQKSG